MIYKTNTTRGKIHDKLISLFPKNWIQGINPNLFFKLKKNDFPPIKTIDLTSESKLKKLPNYTYGFPLKNYSTNISIPGCSALLSLLMIHKISEEISNIFIETNFPLSAIQENSPNKQKLKNINAIELSIEHYHQKEIENYINKKINYKTILSNRDDCIIIDLEFESSQSIDYIIKHINDVNINLVNKINTDNVKEQYKIEYQISKNNNKFNIKCTFDNIYYICMYTYLMTLLNK